jgi:hypothetical protein
MKKFLVMLAVMIGLSGCASWKELTEAEKIAWSVSSAIIVGSAIIASSSGDTVKVGGNGCHTHGNPPNRWDCPDL